MIAVYICIRGVVIVHRFESIRERGTSVLVLISQRLYIILCVHVLKAAVDIYMHISICTYVACIYAVQIRCTLYVHKQCTQS